MHEISSADNADANIQENKQFRKTEMCLRGPVDTELEHIAIVTSYVCYANISTYLIIPLINTAHANVMYAYPNNLAKSMVHH